MAANDEMDAQKIQLLQLKCNQLQQYLNKKGEVLLAPTGDKLAEMTDDQKTAIDVVTSKLKADILTIAQSFSP